MTTSSSGSATPKIPEEGSAPVERRSTVTDDLEAQFLFEYRDFSLPRTFRFVENRGRLWLYAYIVPAVIIAVGWLLWCVSTRYNWRTDILTPVRLIVSTLGLSTTSAIVLGLFSISRGESRSYFAYQPLISACLTILFALVWALTMRH
jgi:hypothetical protein